MEITEIERYTKMIIPNLERKLSTEEDKDALIDLYNLYKDVLILIAPYDFITYNKALEFEEDKRRKDRGFYHHRKDHIGEIFEALNDMEIYDKYDYLIISTPSRIGKALPNYEKVLTPNGWTTMGELKVGEKVIGSSGNAVNITGVFPQGNRDMYRVTFDDDTTVDCDLEHLWTVRTIDDRGEGKERTVTTGDMMKNLYRKSGHKNYSIDYVEPIEFENTLNSDDIHPYVLGALLGDGSLYGNFSITNKDGNILDRIKELLPEDEVLHHVNNSIAYNIKNKHQRRNELGYPQPCDTLYKIREYGLDVTTRGKFIPNEYLYSSKENRLELLKGLMDTDGSVVVNKGTNSSYNEIVTVSEQLSKDLTELIRSLGGRATVTTKIGSYTKDGKRHECSKVYRVFFNMILNPYYTPSKRELFSPRETRPYKYIKSIEKIGNEECTCISVDDDRNLFVANGYNLTHNSTTGIRFLSWIMGRYPEETQLATSYTDSITQSFYNGTMEIVMSDMFKLIFPDAPLQNQNAKRQEIWLKIMKRYPTITFAPIGGSVTGRAEASKYLYCDDLVSGIELALSPIRLEKLWQIYTDEFKQRKLDGAKEIHIATRWSVHDPVTKLAKLHEDNPRAKVISIPCYDENGESNFDYFGGFSTEYYNDLEQVMDELSFQAVFMCNPIEREGLLYHKEDLQYYFDLPSEKADIILSVADTKGTGKDFVASPIGYVYGDLIYIEDVVYNNGLPELTIPLLASKWVNNGVVRGDIEMNNGGDFYATNVNSEIKKLGGNTSIRTFFTSQNKEIKIITFSDFVKKQFVFKDPSTYPPSSDYAKFMANVFSWTQTAKNKFDDAPDSLAMLAQLIQDLKGNSVRTLSRKELRI